MHCQMNLYALTSISQPEIKAYKVSYIKYFSVLFKISITLYISKEHIKYRLKLHNDF